jgi:chemotaxis protein MotA
MDIASIGGIALAILGILAGMMIEGGSITQIIQPTAAMIVFGGTFGAVMLQFPMNIFLAALKAILKVFLHKSSNGEATLAQIVSFANKARRSGIVSLSTQIWPLSLTRFSDKPSCLPSTALNQARFVRSCNSS